MSGRRGVSQSVGGEGGDGERAVPVEGTGVKLAVAGLTADAVLSGGAGRALPSSSVEWESEDGRFEGEGMFVPARGEVARVRAKACGLIAESEIPVEEAIRVRALTLTPTNVIAVVGGEVVERVQR